MSDYADLVELGFEGLDRFADKINIPGVTTKWKKTAPVEKGGLKQPDQQPRELPKDLQREAARAHSLPPEQCLRGSRGFDEDARTTFAPDGRRNRDWDDWYRDDIEAGLGTAPPNDRAFYDNNAGEMGVVQRGRDMGGNYGGYQMVPQVQPPVYGYAPPYAPPYVPLAPSPRFEDRSEDMYAVDRGRPSLVRRRTSSYSPPRRSYRDRRDSPRRRTRSRSSDRQKVATAVVGALAGGLIGNAAKKDSAWSTMAGAVVGGLGAREAEKMFDRRKEQEIEEEERRQRRRRRREREREREREEWRDWRD